MSTKQPIRIGMVGGGEGAFIGAVHRMAFSLDGHYRLVAGALSSDAARARRSADAWGLDPDRSYASYDEMAEREAARPDGIEAAVIVTPNHVHVPAAIAFARRGIHVICDKPLAARLDDAEKLVQVVGDSGVAFILTHNYSGYPMVRQAREMVASGALGTLRLVKAQYAQDWLTTRLEESGHKQADWRTDPARSGLAGCVGDIGTHAMHLAGFVSGLELEAVAADLSRFVPGRRLDDDAAMLLRFKGGAKGSLWCSQVAPGHENDLRLAVYGDKGGLRWSQEDPNALIWAPYGEPVRRLTRAGAGLGPAGAHASRLPAGHPEGYLEAFAQLYVDAAAVLRARRDGQPAPAVAGLLPGLADGLAGMRFIAAAVRSSAAQAAWVTVDG